MALNTTACDHAWRYRDWVIDALNRDLPYDVFARLQIGWGCAMAGDEAALDRNGLGRRRVRQFPQRRSHADDHARMS
jgi:hypothetical protein